MGLIKSSQRMVLVKSSQTADVRILNSFIIGYYDWI